MCLCYPVFCVIWKRNKDNYNTKLVDKPSFASCIKSLPYHVLCLSKKKNRRLTHNLWVSVYCIFHLLLIHLNWITPPLLLLTESTRSSYFTLKFLFVPMWKMLMHKRSEEKVWLIKEEKKKNGLIRFSPLKITKRNQHVFVVIPLSFGTIRPMIFLYFDEQKDKEANERSGSKWLFVHICWCLT